MPTSSATSTIAPAEGPGGTETAVEPRPSGPATLVETHSSVLVFFGDRVYKAKKPVDLGFLDFRSRAQRQRACEDEVRLNRRLAPDVYLGVATVVGPDGEPCDHLVVMRRLPEDRRLSRLVVDGEAVGTALEAVARQVAVLHAAEPPTEVAALAASPSALARRWADDLEVVGAHEQRLGRPGLAEAASRAVDRYLAGRSVAFAERVRAGRAHDGHGDLMADDIYCLDDGPRVLDCLDFAEELRLGDALADVAFLAMDLDRLGRPDLGEGFLAAYAGFTGDRWPASLAHHHIAYRASVRAKVACLRAAQGDPAGWTSAALHADVMARHLDAGRVHLVVVGGLPATGKSTVAAGVADALHAVWLRSDEVRRDVAGLPREGHRPAGYEQGAYDPGTTDATYAEVLRRARVLLDRGHPVVLDATWREPRWREAARLLAVEASADLTELRCRLPVAEAVRRAEVRQRLGHDPSDAGPEVVRLLAGGEPPWPTALDLATMGAPGPTIARAVEHCRRTDLARLVPAGGAEAGAACSADLEHRGAGEAVGGEVT